MGVSTAIHGRFVGCRVFLEGIEVDVVQATITGGVNTPATADIIIPYNDFIHEFLPRTLVHVFFMDSRYRKGKEVDTEKTKDLVNAIPRLKSTKDLRKAALALDRNDPDNWKLMFAGEVSGYSYQKVGALRQCKLSCMDFSSYFQNAKLYWGRRNTSLHSYKQAIFAGGTQLYRGKTKVDSSNDLVKLLSSKPSLKPTLPGLLGGLFSTLESVTGVYSPDATRKFRGTNDFLSQAELRLNICSMLGASEKDDTTTTFLRSKSFKRYLRRITRQLKSTASYYDIMNLILQKCYQVWSSVPAPPYMTDQSVVVKWNQVVNGYSYKKDPAVKKIFDETAEVHKRIGTHLQVAIDRTVGRSKGKEGSVPAGTDPAKHKIQGGKVAVDTKEISTTATTVASKTKDWGTAEQLREKGSQHYQKHGVGPKRTSRAAAAKIRGAYGHLANAKAHLDKIKADGGKKQDVPLLRKAYAELEAAKKKMVRAAGVRTKPMSETLSTNPRLHAFLFHPDIFMCPPPKCNVLFPDDIQSLSFSRGWMSEITRIWLHGRTSSGKARKNCYFAPNTSILGASEVGSKGEGLAETAIKKGHGFLMPHEKYTGINGSIVGLGDNAIFKKLHVKGLKEAKKVARAEAKKIKGTDAEAKAKRKKLVTDAINDFSGGAQFSAQPHLQRAANYMFFASRYGSRSMSVTCRFSPHLVASLPCLVLDPDVDQDSRFVTGRYSTAFATEGDKGEPSLDSRGFSKRAWEQDASGTRVAGTKGTHYVGVIAKVQHTFNANGGAQTQVMLTKCREHNESGSFWGDDDGDGVMHAKAVKKKYWRRRVRMKSNGGSIHSTDHSDYDPKVTGNINGNFTARVVRKAGSAIAVEKQTPGALKAILGSQWRKNRSYTVEPVMENGQPKTVVVGSPQTLADGSTSGSGKEFMAVKVYSRHSKNVVKPISFSFEAITTPPWFASIYHAGKIGSEYYGPMIGCDSVVDGTPLSLHDPEATLKEGTKIKVSTTTIDADTGDEKEAPDLEMETYVLPFKVQGGYEEREVLIPKSLFAEVETTKSAANALADIWIGLKRMGADVNLFIDTYTSRSYANLVQVMGNKNPYLRLNYSIDDYETSALPISPLGKIAHTGFHGFAYGNYTELKNIENYERLLTEGKKALKAMNPRTAKRPLNPKVDPRAPRWFAVHRYQKAMKAKSRSGGQIAERRKQGDFNARS